MLLVQLKFFFYKNLSYVSLDVLYVLKFGDFNKSDSKDESSKETGKIYSYVAQFNRTGLSKNWSIYQSD